MFLNILNVITLLVLCKMSFKRCPCLHSYPLKSGRQNHTWILIWTQTRNVNMNIMNTGTNTDIPMDHEYGHGHAQLCTWKMSQTRIWRKYRLCSCPCSFSCAWPCSTDNLQLVFSGCQRITFNAYRQGFNFQGCLFLARKSTDKFQNYFTVNRKLLALITQRTALKRTI